jgi:hypothetical protein
MKEGIVEYESGVKEEKSHVAHENFLSTRVPPPCRLFAVTTYLDLEPGEVGRVLLELDERHLDVFFVVTDYYRRYERRRRVQDRYTSITFPPLRRGRP